MPRTTPTKKKKKSARLLSTGSTLLNLACSDNPFFAWLLGKIINIIGDSHSGKTMLALSVCAEIATQRSFDDHKLILDDAEAANEFNIKSLFGAETAARIEPPAYDADGEPMPSSTAEEFQYNVHTLLDKKQKFIYILDSLDALESEADQKKLKAAMKARTKKIAAAKGKKESRKPGEKEEKEKGSYGLGKPKLMSALLREIVRRLKKTDSVLIIISQTRSVINPMSFATKYRAGGDALQFYSSHVMWLAVLKKLLKTQKRPPIGILCRVKSTKSKLTGKVRTVTFPIYNSYGVDDIGSCIDWLVDEEAWPKKGNTIIAKGLRTKGTRAKLIKFIEENDLEKALKRLTAREWNRIEDSLKLDRKKKYK